MTFLILVLVLTLIVAVSHRFNQEKLDDIPWKIWLISILEGLFGFGIIMMFLLVGFLSTFLMWFGSFLLIIGAGYVAFTIQKDLDSDLDWQIETAKNGLVVFLRTAFPLFVFLTIFRFQPALVQMGLALAATLLINIIALPFQRMFYHVWVKVIRYFQTTFILKYVWLWVVAFVLIALSFLFRFPKDHVAYALNLSDHAPYVHLDRFPVNLNNAFKSRDVLSVRVSNPLDAQIVDYALWDNVLYLYTTNEKIYVYDLEKESVLEYVLSDAYLQKSANRKELVNHFFENNGSLYVLGKSGLYQIIDEAPIYISDLHIGVAHRFVMNEENYFMRQLPDKQYALFRLDGHNLDQIEIYSLEGTSFIKFVVIADTLFYQSLTHYTRFDQPDESYAIRQGVPAYDAKNRLMYYARNVHYSDAITHDTQYYQIDQFGQVQFMSFIRSFNMVGLVVDGHYVLTTPDSFQLERFEIMNSDFKHVAIHNPVNNTPFWIENQWTNVYMGNIRNQNGTLEYLQVESNQKHLLLTLRVLEHKEIGLSLPFYSHYALWVWIFILLGLIVPITNDRQYVTIIGFDQMTRKKEY